MARNTVVLAIVAVVAACGGRLAPLAAPVEDADGAALAPDPTADAGTPEAAARAVPFPAFLPDAPQLVSSGGPVLASPTMVPMLFAGDPLAAPIEDFSRRLGATKYWTTLAGDYGVGAIASAAPVVFTESLPARIDAAALTSWLAARVEPATGRVFVLFVPAAVTVVLDGGAACDAFAGYHYEAKTPAGATFPFIIVPRCAAQPPLSELDVLTVTLSHELLEAATDPFPVSAPAYRRLDAAHFAWQDQTGGEVGDLCEASLLYAHAASFDYLLQRQWSNSSIAAGHDPCVLVDAGEVYFNAAPAEPDSIFLAKKRILAKGTRVHPGETRTIELALYSDADTGGPWLVTATDLDAFYGEPKTLELSLDKGSGANGDKLALTVKTVAQSARGFSVVIVSSTKGTRTNNWPTIIGY